MKIDKSKLMKRAWEIAKNGFYAAAFRSIVAAGNIENVTEDQIETLCAYSLDKKREAFHARRIQAVMNVDFTVSDFFSESLKIAWAKAKLEIKKQNEKKLERERDERKRDEILANAVETNKNAHGRELIPADKYSIGDKLYGFVITELGREFRPDTDMFSMGITPDTEYVQYAYFN